MFIKLAFTNSSMKISVPLRILADIINTSGITSVSALQSRFTSASYDTTLTQYFDAANSQIIRTSDPTNTKAHLAHWGQPANMDFIFTLEQPVYDSSGNKVYTQISTDYTTGTAGTYGAAFRVGSSISGGTMSSSQTAVTVPESSTTAGIGTKLTLGGTTAMSSSTYMTSNGAPYANVLWAYITDKCFFWALSTTAGSIGFPATGNLNNYSYYTGPIFQTQYTRYDYHNTMSNGITPVLYSNNRYTASLAGYGAAADITAINNYLYTSSVYTFPMRVHSIINATPNTTVSWPLISNPYVNLTMNGVSAQVAALSSAQYTGGATTFTAQSYAGAYTTTTSARYATSNLAATGFGIMPFGWECNYYNNHGGNATDQNGVYFFNGEYAPGDTFTMNTVQYMVWPMYAGVSYRLGLAVPMV